MLLSIWNLYCDSEVNFRPARNSARLRRCRYVISIIRVALPVRATANPVARQRPSSRIRNISFDYRFLGLRRWGQVRPRGVRTISSRYARNGCTSKRRRRPPAESRRAGWRAAAHLPPRCICACVGPCRGSSYSRTLADDRRVNRTKTEHLARPTIPQRHAEQAGGCPASRN